MLDSFNSPSLALCLCCFHAGPLPAVCGMTGRTNVCSGAITQLGFHTYLSQLNLRPLPPTPRPTFYLLSSLLWGGTMRLKMLLIAKTLFSSVCKVLNKFRSNIRLNEILISNKKHTDYKVYTFDIMEIALIYICQIFFCGLAIYLMLPVIYSTPSIFLVNSYNIFSLSFSIRLQNTLCKLN